MTPTYNKEEESNAIHEASLTPLNDHLPNSPPSSKVPNGSPPSVVNGRVENSPASNLESPNWQAAHKNIDCGYAWVVVIGSFFSNFIADGVTFSFGVLYAEMLDFFNDSHFKTVITASIFYSLPLIVSPIVSLITTKFGCRTVATMGSLISSLGFCMSYYAQSNDFLIWSIGVVAGLGLSMVYMPATIIVSFYFDKRRALATGIAVSGSGVGTLVFSPLISFLLRVYGFHGTMLLLGGITLNAMVCAMLYRPYKDIQLYYELRDERKLLEKQSTKNDTDSSKIPATKPEDHCSSSTKSINSSLHSDKSRIRSSPMSEPLLKVNDRIQDFSNNCRSSFSDHRVFHQANDLLNRGSKNRLTHSVINLPTCYETQCIPEKNDTYSSLDVALGLNNQGNTNAYTKTRIHRSHAGICLLGRRRVIFTNKLFNSDPFETSAFLSCPELYSTKKFHAGYHSQSECNEALIHHKNACNSRNQSPLRHTCLWLRSTWSKLDVSLLKDWRYLLFFLSNLLLYLFYDSPYLYLPDYGKELSMQHCELFLSVLGVTNTVGQIAIGYIADVPRFNTVFIYAICIGTTGVLTFAVPYFTNYTFFIVYSALYGLFISANYSLVTIIIVELFTIRKLTNGYGIILCAQGVANLIGPLIGGKLRDNSGNYMLTFQVSGLVVGISAIILAPILLQNLFRSAQRIFKRKREEIAAKDLPLFQD